MDLLCVECGMEIKDADKIEGYLPGCPSCGTKGVPAALPRISVEITWQELRVLIIWAESHASRANNPATSGIDMLKTVWSIAHRLEAQHRDLPPLTLSGELKELGRVLADDFPGATVETDIPIEPDPLEHRS